MKMKLRKWIFSAMRMSPFILAFCFVLSFSTHFYFIFICQLSDIFTNYRLCSLRSSIDSHRIRIEMNSIMVFTDYSASLILLFGPFIPVDFCHCVVSTPFDVAFVMALLSYVVLFAHGK